MKGSTVMRRMSEWLLWCVHTQMMMHNCRYRNNGCIHFHKDGDHQEGPVGIINLSNGHNGARYVVMY